MVRLTLPHEYSAQRERERHAYEAGRRGCCGQEPACSSCGKASEEAASWDALLAALSYATAVSSGGAPPRQLDHTAHTLQRSRSCCAIALRRHGTGARDGHRKIGRLRLFVGSRRLVRGSGGGRGLGREGSRGRRRVRGGAGMALCRADGCRDLRRRRTLGGRRAGSGGHLPSRLGRLLPWRRCRGS